jgi:peptidoglycan/LPS O-acetylase OafA/YrhL
MDALRLLAALAVVLFHFTAREQHRWGMAPDAAFPRLSEVTPYGYAGVHLFFTISGFVILMSAWGRSVPQFVASRVSRLYPAFWAAVLLTAALRWAWPTFETRTPGEVLVNLTMLSEPLGVPAVDGVYWTLWVELQFYAAVLLLLLVGLTRRRVLLLAGLGPLVCTALTLAAPGLREDVTGLPWASMFGAGMVLYVIYREGHTRGTWALVGLNTAQGVVLAVDLKAPAIDHLTTGAPIWPPLLALAVIAAVAAVAVVAFVPAVRDLDLPVLTTAGALTYPLYLTHEYYGWALIQALHPVLGRVTTLVVVVGVCLALAWVLHRWVERPLQRPLRRAVERALTWRGRRDDAPGRGPAPVPPVRASALVGADARR